MKESDILATSTDPDLHHSLLQTPQNAYISVFIRDGMREDVVLAGGNGVFGAGFDNRL